VKYIHWELFPVLAVTREEPQGAAQSLLAVCKAIENKLQISLLRRIAQRG
jgi:hypothetical protein